MAIFANTIDGNEIYAKRAEQDKDGNPIRSVPSPGTNEHRGEVLTVNNSDEVVWAPTSGGGGSGLPDASLLADAETAFGDKLSEDTDTFSVNTNYEMRYNFIPTAMNQDGSIHTYKIKWYVKAGSGGFETAAVGSGSFT